MANHTACCSLPIINMYLFPLIITCVCLNFVSATSNITTTQFLRDHETLVSSNSAFKIGFFSTINSTNRYLGIWYNTNDKESNRLEIIWVANRDKPINDTSGVLKISKDGGLQLVDGQNMSFWSSNTSVVDGTTVAAQLLDTGNLVLVSGSTGMNIWQSFEHSTDSWLPSMTFIVNLNAMENQMVTSWKSSSDPSSGSFKFGIVPRNLPEFFTLDGDKPYWRSGPWNGYLYIGVPFMNSMVSTGVNIIDRHDGTLYVAYSVLNRSLLERFMLNYDGRLMQKDWNNTSLRWEVVWQSIESECDMYGKCGPFGICDSKTSPICSCLTGFEPKVIDEWSKGDWSRGCVRKTELNCDSTVGKEDGFLGYKHVKVPDYSYRISLPASDPDVCRKNCSRNCSCLAYAHYSGIGCMIWNRSLTDIQQFTGAGADLFVRLAHSDIPGQSRKWKIITAVLVVMGSALCVAILCIMTRRLNRQRGEKVVFDAADFKDLHLFTLENLKIATTNFSECNKLGQGGFGPVYKGKLEDGQEIAVKRLSKASGQGAEEFMNEVIVISKLQHKNLVRLLGCCVQGEEKLLVYEYMPKKSLDALLFDPGHKQQLDWKTRLKIIKGICRGLMYLHRDSRLRIIHRDLKASNILLDEELDPKISDFGMARIFDTKQDQANTLRVVGTYGYMSPEYAMEGRFSEKSDVYSLGVLLLEMVSGRKNKSFLHYEFPSLLAYAWKLWNENDMLSFIDPAICDPCCEYETLRCIQLGLLCVQELPEDRPCVSTLIYLLDNNAIDVPHPKQPGFTQTTKCSANNVSQDGQECSVNHLTTTLVSGR